MTTEKEITLEESYVKYPFLKKLDKEELATLLASIVILVLLGPKSYDTLLHAIKAILAT